MSIEELLKKYEQIENEKPDFDDYPTNDDYIQACYNHLDACDQIRVQLKEQGYIPSFVRLDTNGWYHYQLVHI